MEGSLEPLLFFYNKNMAGKINIVNIHTTDCSGVDNYYYIGRSRSGNPLSNPFTYNGKKSSLAKLTFKTRDEAINAYEKYFEAAYGQPGYEELTNAFNEIYEKYKKGEDITLGCFCYPLRCHGNVIASQLQKKLIREKIAEMRKGM